MKNYWLDKMSNRLSKERCQRIEIFPGGNLVAIGDMFSKIKYMLELKQNNQVVLKPFPASVSCDGMSIVFAFKDIGKFPMRAYSWLSNLYDWGRKENRQPVQAVVKKYINGKEVAGATLELVMNGLRFEKPANPRDDATELYLNFELIGHKAL